MLPDFVKEKTFHYRIISSLFLALIVIASIFYSFKLYCLMLLIIYVGVTHELFKITEKISRDFIIGMCFISFSTFSLLSIRLLDHSGFILFWYATIISSYDSFAMIGGKLIGGRKLAQSISPHKTWSGFLSGLISSLVIVSIFNIFMDFTGVNQYVIFRYGLVFPTILIALLAQAGDLFESCLKRKYHCKDSGRIIPGHGGMLDRFDSNVFAAPVLMLMMLM